VLNWWLHQGLTNRMVGIELDERFAGTTVGPACGTTPMSPSVRGSALDHIPADGTIFFLFNPFKPRSWKRSRPG